MRTFNVESWTNATLDCNLHLALGKDAFRESIYIQRTLSRIPIVSQFILFHLAFVLLLWKIDG